MKKLLVPSVDVERTKKKSILRSEAQQKVNTKLLIGAIALFVAFILFIYIRNKIVKQQLIDLKNPTVVNVPVCNENKECRSNILTNYLQS